MTYKLADGSVNRLFNEPILGYFWNIIGWGSVIRLRDNDRWAEVKTTQCKLVQWVASLSGRLIEWHPINQLKMEQPSDRRYRKFAMIMAKSRQGCHIPRIIEKLRWFVSIMASLPWLRSPINFFTQMRHKQVVLIAYFLYLLILKPAFKIAALYYNIFRAFL